MWFTNYDRSNWTPKKGYNERFKKEVQAFRTFFNLTPDGVGREINGFRDFNLQGEDVRVLVDWFIWNDYRDVLGVPTPVFKFKIKVIQLKLGGDDNMPGFFDKLFAALGLVEIGKKGDVWSVLFNQSILMEYPANYPHAMPRFRILSAFYSFGVSHSHHALGEWLCLTEQKNPDWVTGRDNGVSAMTMALDWVVWHYKKYGI